MYDSDSHIYNNEEEAKGFIVETMEMVVSYGSREGRYDLCPKCRKAFERFMRNESD